MEVPEDQVNLASTIVAKVALSPGLYVVATPIGNLRDVTLRALDTLASAHVVACEDTRMTRRLMDRYGISTQTIRYDDHSGDRDRDNLIDRIGRGDAVALVSDAGTPLVSDPGFKLVRAVASAGHRVIPIPGPSSTLAALSAAGLPSDRFHFAGFLPEKQAARQTALAALLARDETIIVFEAARRLPSSLADIAAAAPDREIVIGRELTKRFEELVRGQASALAERYHKDGPPKGEVVLMFAPADQDDADDAQMDAALREALKHLSVKEAATALAYVTGHKRRDLYNRAVELANDARDP